MKLCKPFIDHISTRRPLSTGIVSAKKLTHHHGFEATTPCLPGRRTTNFAMVTRCSKQDCATTWSKRVLLYYAVYLNKVIK